MTTALFLYVAHKYPFYAVAFHPEKVMFDWTPYKIPIPHSGDAIQVSQFFCNFFINEGNSFILFFIYIHTSVSKRIVKHVESNFNNQFI